MTRADERRELRPHLRSEPVPDDSTIVVRGGPATAAKLASHARRTHDAYVLDGRDLWGVSVFCALDDIGPGSLDALLQRFASYSLVHLPSVERVRDAGFELLPSFGRPHFTLRLQTAEAEELAGLLDALGPARPNPYHSRHLGRR